MTSYHTSKPKIALREAMGAIFQGYFSRGGLLRRCSGKDDTNDKFTHRARLRRAPADRGTRAHLGGVDIPYEKGLLGHSDADVLTHAVMDALLGAAALGDIGKLFPDSDAAFRGISSIELLKRVRLHLTAAGFEVVNLDATVLAQAPKLAPYREQMRANIAGALSIPVSRVSIKATTEEGLGFTGSGEGIAAHAVALLEQAEN